jgi:lipid-A-disaccharide synthase
MTTNVQKHRIFLSAAEPSADAHCAALAHVLSRRDDIELVGVGGPKMAEAGVELLESTVRHAAMTYKAFAKVLYFRSVIKKIKNYLMDNRTDLVIVCDSPAFNFHVAKVAKSLGTKTVFYVAPQLWAWAPWRINKLKKSCDKLCCILPFEEAWFKERSVDAEFVGNPLLEESNCEPAKKYYLGFEPDRAKIAIMPGSRAAEIQSLWIPMQQIALGLQGKYPKMQFTVVALDDETEQTLRSQQLQDFSCEYSIGSVYTTARVSDFAIVTSGSATVQIASAGCPMVIMYQSSKILWHLVGRWLVNTEHLSLVNILAKHELVPEFMPYFDSVEPIESRIEGLLVLKDLLVQTSSELVELIRSLTDKHASEQVAQIVEDMLNQK